MLEGPVEALLGNIFQANISIIAQVDPIIYRIYNFFFEEIQRDYNNQQLQDFLGIEPRTRRHQSNSMTIGLLSRVYGKLQY